jgi:predicted RNA-binding protein with TRAM domain
MKATQINPDLQNEFEDVAKLEAGSTIFITGVDFGETPKQKLACATIQLKDGSKRFTTGAKVLGQLRSDFYQNLITEAVKQGDALEVKVESVEANTGRQMLSLNIY